MTRSYSVLLQVTLIISSLVLLVNCNNPETADDNPNAWKAPESSKDLKNPYKNDSTAISKGRDLYKVYCWQCHGENGYGDGAAGGALGQQPANFHSGRVRRQADGELFWKLSNGKGNMPPFKESLKEEERLSASGLLHQWECGKFYWSAHCRALPDIIRHYPVLHHGRSARRYSHKYISGRD